MALIPIPTKLKGLNRDRAENQRRLDSRIHRAVQKTVLGPLLQDKAKPRSWVWRCADGKKRRFQPSLAAWLADYPEQRSYLGLSDRRCLWCEVKPNQLERLPEDYGKRMTDPDGRLFELPAKELAPPRDYAEYERRWLSHSADELKELKAEGVILEENPLWGLHGPLVDVPKPDILHTIYLGLMKDVLKWVDSTLESLGLQDVFNTIWANVPGYHDIPKPTKTHREVSVWQGKEIRHMARYLLAVISATVQAETDVDLTAPTLDQAEGRTDESDSEGEEGDDETAVVREGAGSTCPENHDPIELIRDARKRLDTVNDLLEATRGIMEFSLYCQYREHTDASLSNMRMSLRQFHEKRHVFLASRLTSFTKRKKAGTDEAVRAKGEFYYDQGVAHLPPDHAYRISYRKYIDQWVETQQPAVLEATTGFNYPKMHLLTHFTDQIERFGCLQHCSAETCELCHKYLLKSAYGHTNKTGDTDVQMINWIERNQAFAMRELNRLARANYAAYRETIDGPEDAHEEQDVFWPEAPFSHATTPHMVMASVRSRQKVGKPERQLRFFSDLVELVDVAAFMTATSRYFRKHHAVPIGWDSDELLSYRVDLHHLLSVPVKEFGESSWKIHRARSTVATPFQNRVRRDWVWKRIEGPAYDRHSHQSLHGRLPFRLNCLFKFTEGFGTSPERPLCLAFGEVVEPVDDGHLQNPSAMPRVELTGMYEVIRANTIEGLAHLVPELRHAKQRPEQCQTFTVNTHIDIETFNYVWEDGPLKDVTVEAHPRR